MLSADNGGMKSIFAVIPYSSFILPLSSFRCGVLLAAAILAGCGKTPPPAVNEIKADKSAPSAGTLLAQKPSALQWPPHFSPPLEIRVAVPKVPAKILGPSPPLAEKKS